MPKNVSVKVPQSDGEVSIAFGGDEPTVYKITDGTASVPEENVARFLAAVDGSSVSGNTTAASTKEKN